MLCFAIGSFLSPFVLYFEKYVFNDWQFVISLSTLVAIDTILGIWNAHKRNEISSRDFSQLLTKAIIYMLLLAASHQASSYKIDGVSNTILSWVDGALYAGIVVRELISILENCGKLGFIVPAWILAKLKDFDENGKFKEDKTV